MAVAPQPEDPLDLDELLKPTPTSVGWLRQRIRDLRQYQELKARLTSKQLAHDLQGGVTEDDLDQFIGGKKRLSVASHEALVWHLEANRWISDTWLKIGMASHDDALFHALTSFLESGERTLINHRYEIAGTYRVWRASLHAPGKLILGKMVFSNNIDTGAVKAVETHIYRGDDLTSPQVEIFEGFIVKKSHYSLVIARQSGKHKGPPRTTVFHNTVYGKGGIVSALEGVVIGCYGSNTLFTTSVYLERVDDKEALDAQLNIVDTVPALVAAKLNFKVVDNVIRF